MNSFEQQDEPFNLGVMRWEHVLTVDRDIMKD